MPWRKACGKENKGSPPQAAGYFRREPVGESRVASGTPGLTSWRGRGSWPGLTPQAAGNAPKGIQILIGLLISNGPGAISAQGAKGAVSADGPQTPGRVQINKA